MRIYITYKKKNPVRMKIRVKILKDFGKFMNLFEFNLNGKLRMSLIYQVESEN